MNARRGHRQHSSWRWQSWLRQSRGATTVEYLVALTLMALVVLGVTKLMGSTLYEKYSMGDERISNMEHQRRSLAGGVDDNGNVVGAKELERGGSNAAYAKHTRIKNMGGKTSSSSSGSSSEDEDDKQKLTRRSFARQQGYNAYGPKNGGGGSASRDEILDPKMRNEHYALRGEKPPEEFRFNPIIIILAILLLLGLGYIIVKGNKEGGDD